MTEILLPQQQLPPTTTIPPSNQSQSLFFTPIDFLRLLFYAIVIIKMIQLIFLRKKRHSIKQRIYRKFLFAHQELLRQFTDDDKSIMQKTLSNTLINAGSQQPTVSTRRPRKNKNVSFILEKNNYYEPKPYKQQDNDDDYLDIEETTNFLKKQDNIDFNTKKIQEEFQERERLEVFEEKSDSLSTLPSGTKPKEDNEVDPFDLPIQGRLSQIQNNSKEENLKKQIENVPNETKKEI